LFLFPTPYSTRYFQGTLDHHFPFRSESTKMHTAKRFLRDGRPAPKNHGLASCASGRVRRADLRLLKHTSSTATRDSGSYEIAFPDGRPSVYFYRDDNPRPPIDHPEAEQRGSRAQGEGTGAGRTGRAALSCKSMPDKPPRLPEGFEPNEDR
jgi:hypothetical protein